MIPLKFQGLVTQRPDVGPAVCRLPSCLFGRHVRCCTERGSRLGQHRPAREFRQAKSDNLRHTVGCDNDIGWLNIPMYDAVLMRFGQALCNLSGDINSIINLQRTPLDLFLERLPLKVVHADKNLPDHRADSQGMRSAIVRVRGGKEHAGSGTIPGGNIAKRKGTIQPSQP